MIGMVPIPSRSLIMARKRVPKVNAVQEPKIAKPMPVRLDLLPADYERLERQARARGLNKASYARMAVLERLKRDEESD